MGGNALKSGSVRLPVNRYLEVESKLIGKLMSVDAGRRAQSVVSYGSKADFGDLDILIVGGQGYDPVAIANALGAVETVRNGPTTSLGIEVPEGIFQVDLISIPADSFDFAENYFGHNDFGNLLGRVAHKFGAKFGHDGLIYPIRNPDDDSHMIEEVAVTKDFDVALSLLGYDPEHYRDLRNNGGFQTLEDIFKFVVTSPFVNRDIYLLDNRSHKARIRDAKRPTYNAFLAWLDERPDGSIPAFQWGEGGSELRTLQKQAFMKLCFDVNPDFKAAHDNAILKFQRNKLVKRQFNGEAASSATGITHKALGELMAKVRDSFESESAFERFFIESSVDEVRRKYQEIAESNPAKQVKNTFRP